MVLDLGCRCGEGVRKVDLAGVRDMHESTGAAAIHCTELLLWGGGWCLSGISLFWSCWSGMKSVLDVAVWLGCWLSLVSLSLLLLSNTACIASVIFIVVVVGVVVVVALVGVVVGGDVVDVSWLVVVVVVGVVEGGVAFTWCS